jgi:hypothetical protein
MDEGVFATKPINTKGYVLDGSTCSLPMNLQKYIQNVKKNTHVITFNRCQPTK